MAWALILLFLTLAAPLRAGLTLRWTDGKLGGRAGLMVWGVRWTADWRLGRDAENRLEIRLLRGKRETALPLPRKGIGSWRKKRRSPGARFLAGRILTLISFSADILIGGEDAARTAFLSGLVQALGALLPRFRLRCRPKFHGKTSVFLFCIAQARLGILIALCLRGFVISLFAGRKEEQPWIVPSGT